MHMRTLSVCLVMILVVFLTACFHTSDIKPLSVKTVAEIERIYNENETLFKNAAEVLVHYVNYEFMLIKSVEAERREYIVPVWFYDEGGLLITSSEPLSEAQCQEIQAVAEPLIVEHNLFFISCDLGRVRFQIDQGAGQTADLLYLTADGETALGFGTKEERYFDENWYAAITSD